MSYSAVETTADWVRAVFGGQKKARTYFVGAITGSAILHVLYEQALKHGLTVYEEWFRYIVGERRRGCEGCCGVGYEDGRVALDQGQGGHYGEWWRGTHI